MTIHIDCPSCHRTISVPEDLLRRQIKCRACGVAFSVANSYVAQPVTGNALAAATLSPDGWDEPAASGYNEHDPIASQPPGKLADFLTFRRMITPFIIQVIFWMCLILTVLSGIVQILVGLTGGPQGRAPIASGFVTILVGPIFVRIACELLILFFRMNDTLTDIRNNTSQRSS